MKKRFLFLLITAMLLLLCSCGGGGDAPGGGGEDSGGADGEGKPSKDYYTVSFETGTDKVIEPVTVKAGEKIDKPSIPRKTGYSFKGWYNGDSEWNFYKDTVNEDMTLVARRELSEYMITYELNGGECDSLITSYTVESGDITLPIPTKGGMKFDGWLSGTEFISRIKAGTIGNMKLEAIFYDSKPTGELPEGVYAYAENGDGVIKVKTVGELTEAVTLRVELPEDWYIVEVYEDGKRCYAETDLENGTAEVTFELKPGCEAELKPTVLRSDMMLDKISGVEVKEGVTVDVNYYPGFVRKAVTFTIDDGRIDTDTLFLDIVRPAGIIGTFNLNRANAAGLELYLGYEVANHHRLHCLPLRDGFDYSKIEIKDEIFKSGESDPAYIYKSEIDGLYYIDYRHYTTAYKDPYWHAIADNETYAKYIDITKKELEALYGEGSIVGFAYPHGQLNEYVKQYLIKAGYLYARRTGDLKDKTNFALPEDRFAWTYNASVNSLLEVMAKYDAAEDNGTLRFFAFGVHSKDFDGKWDVLREFARLYGNRPEDFYYATNRAIFEYEDAIKNLEVTENGIVNNSDVDVFVAINGVKTLIPAHSEIEY